MQEKLNKLLQALQGYHPQRIILFGSVARGEADADSDLDVLVIQDTADPFVRRTRGHGRTVPPRRACGYPGVYATRTAIRW